MTCALKARITPTGDLHEKTMASTGIGVGVMEKLYNTQQIDKYYKVLYFLKLYEVIGET
jgi:hypothetical protein